MTADQIREKLTSAGFSVVQIERRGRYFEAIAMKDGQAGSLAVDSQTGRLRAEDDD